MKNATRLLTILMLVMIVIPIMSSSVSAYDDSAAQVYADQYWYYHNTSNYRTFNANCTNFVSQCMYAGGVQMDDTWRYNRTLLGLNDTWTYAWSVANSLKNYVKNDLHGLRLTNKWKKQSGHDNHGRPVYAYIDNSSNILGTGIEIVFYDWTDDGTIDHSSIIVGTGTCYEGSGISGTYGDLINQNTTDRAHVIWHLDCFNTHRDTTAIYCFRLS